MSRIINLIISTLGYVKALSGFNWSEKGTEILIVSCDRPFQLKSLIISFTNKLVNKGEINVIILSSDNFIDRYLKLENDLKKYNININFFYQTSSFKKIFIDVLTKTKLSKKDVMLFCDDQILFKKANLKNKKDFNGLMTITSRLGINTNYSFNLDIGQKLPVKKKILKTGYSWNIKNSKGDFAYPFSFDATIFNVNFLLFMSKYLLYKGPNSFESSINYGPRFFRWMGGSIGCFKFQNAVNIVLNTVNKETKNRMKNEIPIEELGKLFDSNYVILGLKNNKKINSPHISCNQLELKIEKINI